MADEVGDVGRVERNAEIRSEEKKDELSAKDKDDVRAAADRVGGPEVVATAARTADPASPTLHQDGFDPGATSGVLTGTGAAARNYGNLDPTRGQGLPANAQPTPKVQAQMRIGDNHTFPQLVDEAAKKSRSFGFVSGDGQVRGGVEVPGARNGKPGNYQWIVEPNGRDVNHRAFVPESQKNPIPRESILSGTNAARIAGRTLLAAGVAMDAYAIATSDDKVKTAVEKGGAWTGALGAASLAGQAAAPLLAVPGYGWLAYGAVVTGAGIAGYFGGEAAASRLYKWATG